MMVGTAAEQTGLVRHTSRLFTVGATLTVPMVMVILRKGYGLGAMAMAGGDFHAPLATLAWPTGEVGGMGLEGAVRLAMRKELAAIEDDDERQRTYEALVAASYEQGSALSASTYDEIDDVIVTVRGAGGHAGGSTSLRPRRCSHRSRSARRSCRWSRRRSRRASSLDPMRVGPRLSKPGGRRGRRRRRQPWPKHAVIADLDQLLGGEHHPLC